MSQTGSPFNEWRFPSTRYRGSKRKILSWIWEKTKTIEFDTALDVFGGTGVVSILFKQMGKSTTFNDSLYFNQQAGLAFIENNQHTLGDDEIEFIAQSDNHFGRVESGFIEGTFKGFYFKDEENRWLDCAIHAIREVGTSYSGHQRRAKIALAFWSLGQACLIKRPFNLFHRKNLYMRTAEVERSFGNKTTWDTPFPDAFKRFAKEANDVVFDNGRSNCAIRKDAFSIDGSGYDLVYIDPPYFFPGQKDVSYRKIYHFLEGLVRYDDWANLIDYDSYNYRLLPGKNGWPARSRHKLESRMQHLISSFANSKIVISHKSGSLVQLSFIERSLELVGKDVRKFYSRYNYALSGSNGKPRKNIEWLIIGV